MNEERQKIFTFLDEHLLKFKDKELTKEQDKEITEFYMACRFKEGGANTELKYFAIGWYIYENLLKENKNDF
jgi:hypothetical protein